MTLAGNLDVDRPPAVRHLLVGMKETKKEKHEAWEENTKINSVREKVSP